MNRFKFSVPLFSAILLLFFTHAGYSQSKPMQLLNKMFNDTTTTGKPKWIAYPTLAFAPETSWEVGVAAVMVYNAKRDITNRLSEAGGFTFVTLEGQYGAHFDHALYSDQNRWFALGKLKFQSYPLQYYGIGSNIQGEELAIANANFALIRERFLRKIYGHWYLGLEVDYERLSQVDFDWFDTPPLAPILGEDGYSNLGLGLGLVYDTRHNVLNVRHGFLSEIGYLLYEPAWGSTNKLRTLFIDTRAFFDVSENTVLALQGVGQFSSGEVPFNQLSMIGGEMMMRGYYLGKYRDENMMAFQSEYRWLPFPFSKRIGGAVFASVGSVSPNLNFDKVLWSAGGGLRVLLFPGRDVYTRLDVGFNPDGYGFYIFIGEAF
ncbi:MAG: BamA/TamA family outer membrane protein [Cyclobacteriaceae bacterium]